MPVEIVPVTTQFPETDVAVIVSVLRVQPVDTPTEKVMVPSLAPAEGVATRPTDLP